MLDRLEALIKEKIVDPEKALSRYAICKECDQFDKEWAKCKNCGCFLKAKVMLPISSCPLKKW